MHIATYRDVKSKRYTRNLPLGGRVWRTEFIGPPPAPKDGETVPKFVPLQPGEEGLPQVFLIEQEPGVVLDPHFHYVDQFQVVVAGDGTLGAHHVAPLSVHFSAAHTGYGPIAPGSEGLSYLTFRASSDGTGAQFLPGARSLMAKVPRRNVFLDRIDLSPEQELGLRAESAIECQLNKPDGLAVYMLRVAPSDFIGIPDWKPGQALALLVAAGSIRRQNAELPRWSCLFATTSEQEESKMTIEAGEGGAEVLALLFPSTPAAAEAEAGDEAVA